jgi:hypothetical protein
MLKGISESATSITNLKNTAAMRADIGRRTLPGNDCTTVRLAGAAGFEPANAGTKTTMPFDRPAESRRILRVRNRIKEFCFRSSIIQSTGEYINTYRYFIRIASVSIAFRLLHWSAQPPGKSSQRRAVEGQHLRPRSTGTASMTPAPKQPHNAEQHLPGGVGEERAQSTASGRLKCAARPGPRPAERRA